MKIMYNYNKWIENAEVRRIIGVCVVIEVKSVNVRSRLPRYNTYGFIDPDPHRINVILGISYHTMNAQGSGRT